MSVSGLSLKVELPRSKSISNRWLILQRLSSHPISIRDLSESSDTSRLYRLLYQNGPIFDAGDGGTTFRFMLAFLNLFPGTHLLTGNSRMAERPMAELIEALVSLGADITYDLESGRLPLKITGGRIAGGVVDVDGSKSSQFVSALLLIAPFLQKGLTINLTGAVVSRSYIEMTIKVLLQAGVHVKFYGQKIEVLPSELKSQTVDIEPDWSAAAFFYQLCSLKAGLKVEFPGLFTTGLQGDEVAIAFFSGLGVKTQPTATGLEISSGQVESDRPLNFDLTDCPDMGPALMMACFGKKRRSVFSGIAHLRHKESDRIHAVSEAIRSAGGELSLEGDILTLIGFPDRFHPLHVDSYDDHRIAMSMAMFSATGCPVSIGQSASVVKSFPGFWEVIRPLQLPLSLS